jgi:ABC-type multidrug transport system ATPase subunit
VSALIELGAGFHPEISGRENVFINGMMLGLSKAEITRRFDEIVAFAELGDFIDAPVKTYSSGMYMRLGFAVAINVDPDVLLVDEVLAVGDEAFTHKCLDKFADFRRRGKTVVLVTHTLDLVTRLCDDALWLDGGRARAHGDPKRVVDAYLMEVAASEGQAGPASGQPATAESDGRNGDGQGRWGSREAEIEHVELLRPDGQAAHVFESGQPMRIRVRAKAARPLHDFVFGIGIFTVDGVCCFGTNTHIEGGVPREFSGSGEFTVDIDRLDLVAGTYRLDVAIHRQDGVPYDYHRLMYSFRVSSPVKDTGIYRPRHQWTFNGGIAMSDPAGGPS